MMRWKIKPMTCKYSSFVFISSPFSPPFSHSGAPSTPRRSLAFPHLTLTPQPPEGHFLHLYWLPVILFHSSRPNLAPVRATPHFPPPTAPSPTVPTVLPSSTANNSHPGRESPSGCLGHTPTAHCGRSSIFDLASLKQLEIPAEEVRPIRLRVVRVKVCQRVHDTLICTG